MGKNKVTLHVDGCSDVDLWVDGEPHNESDLLKYVDYERYYYSIGLGAPVTATVTAKTGLFKSSRYSFTYKIKGNAKPLDWVTAIVKKYKHCSTCEYMHVGTDTTEMLITFGSNDDAYKMYQELEGICNVGVNHGYSRDLGKYIIEIEYHRVAT